ncbi:hypothetical protein [uncultured Vagococcus sp.]|uniref:hypothetical protein n=1 Tax=uncultured Vagococcus sp. TaxID=189676 RepID=UPI0028D144EB|nr:hypothetical protein [uncultured Vagococcus sp.]
MIKKDDLKDWLAEGDRNKSKEKLEAFIDKRIKYNALSGKTTFTVCTGEYTRDGSVKTEFYDLWYDQSLSKNNQIIVQNEVIANYQEFGFDVKKVNVDCGWSNNYPALKFTDIDYLLDESIKDN